MAREVAGWLRLRIPLSVICMVYLFAFNCGRNWPTSASVAGLSDGLKVSYTSFAGSAYFRITDEDNG